MAHQAIHLHHLEAHIITFILACIYYFESQVLRVISAGLGSTPWLSASSLLGLPCSVD